MLSQKERVESKELTWRRACETTVGVDVDGWFAQTGLVVHADCNKTQRAHKTIEKRLAIVTSFCTSINWTNRIEKFVTYCSPNKRVSLSTCALASQFGGCFCDRLTFAMLQTSTNGEFLHICNKRKHLWVPSRSYWRSRACCESQAQCLFLLRTPGGVATCSFV